MAEQLHVVDRFVLAEALGSERLLADHDRRVELLENLLLCRDLRSGAAVLDEPDGVGVSGNDVDLREVVGSCLLETQGRVLAAVDLLAVLVPTETLDELVEGEIEGCVLVTGLRLGADDRAWTEERDLHFALVEQVSRPVRALGQLDFRRLRLAIEKRDLCERLLCGVLAKAVRDLGVATGDRDFHVTLLSFCTRPKCHCLVMLCRNRRPQFTPRCLRFRRHALPSARVELYPASYGFLRTASAITTHPTTTAPPASRARTASRRVAPLVTTSSTRTTRLPASPRSAR